MPLLEGIGRKGIDAAIFCIVIMHLRSLGLWARLERSTWLVFIALLLARIEMRELWPREDRGVLIIRLSNYHRFLIVMVVVGQHSN